MHFVSRGAKLLVHIYHSYLTLYGYVWIFTPSLFHVSRIDSAVDTESREDHANHSHHDDHEHEEHDHDHDHDHHDHEHDHKHGKIMRTHPVCII